jgi:nucleotide-binding universal stress UspA family protein
MRHLRNILFVTEDASTDQTAAMRRAFALAEHNQARLTVLSVLPKPRMGPFMGELKSAEAESVLTQHEYQRLADLLAPGHGSPETATKVRFGIPFVEVVREVLLHDHDLVIKAAGYGGVHEFLFGGIDQHLLRKCPCPVWIVSRESTTNYRRIVAAVDLDPWREEDEDNGLNELILAWAGSLALSEFAELHIVHAWESITEQIRPMFSDLPDEQKAKTVESEHRAYHEELKVLTARLRNSIGEDAHSFLSPTLHVRKGDARRIVPALATELNADLVVMGTVSRTGIPGFLIGNTAEVILNNIECSVLAIKPAGFVTPVEIGD